MKNCGLYIRVSTEKQAKVEEGSLKNQDHHLTQHVAMKGQFGKEPWLIADRYVDEGISAKDTNRPAFQRMLKDVKDGRINTVLCLALSRISRSTRDLLDLVDFFREHEVDFICLKEDVDTTTPMGRLLLTFMGALNQFEREQTGDRTRSAVLARAERGLWNGGHLFGYDLDLAKKGNLLINTGEAEIVNFIFDTYMACGSVIKTRDILNARGHLTKNYTSRRGTVHPARPFCHASTYQILTNQAYIGKRHINKKGGSKGAQKEADRLVVAVWPAIVDPPKFYEAQKLLKENNKTHNNGSAPNKHFYLLNGGILYCQKCGGSMEGRNGHGHKGRKKYYYYVCRTASCRFKLPEKEAEKAIMALVNQLAQSEEIFPKVVEKLNRLLQMRLPELKDVQKRKEKELAIVNDQARVVLNKEDWAGQGKIFVQDELEKLSGSRKALEEDLAQLRHEIESIGNREVKSDIIKTSIQQSQGAFMEELKPYKRKELLNLTIRRLEFKDTECRAAVNLGNARPQTEWSGGSDTTPNLGRGAIIDAQTNFEFRLKNNASLPIWR